MIDINNLDKYDYSDTSTARELIHTLADNLRKVKKLNTELIDYVIKVRNKGALALDDDSLVYKYKEAVIDVHDKIINDYSSTDEE